MAWNLLPKQADVSVIIPAYQAERTIERALQSVANQTLPPKEVIVVDDGSTDQTFSLAQAMEGHIGTISLNVIHQENLGAGAARNRATAEASGLYLAFLDADDEWGPDKLAHSWEYASGGDYVIVSHDVVVRDPDTGDSYIDCARHADNQNSFAAMYRRGYISTSTALALRERVNEVGGFDTSLPNAQDFNLWLKLMSQPVSKIKVFSGAYTIHHNQPGSIQTHTMRRLECCERIALQFFPVLKSRGDNAWNNLWFRETAIIFEAVNTMWANNKIMQSIALACSLPIRLIAISVKAFH